jgi:hypothetical protein
LCNFLQTPADRIAKRTPGQEFVAIFKVSAVVDQKRLFSRAGGGATIEIIFSNRF